MARTFVVKPKPRRIRGLEKTIDLPFLGNKRGEVMMVIDPRVMKGEAPDPDKYTSPLIPSHGRLLQEFRDAAGIDKEKVCIVSASGPVHEELWGREKALAEAVTADRHKLLQAIENVKPKLIMAMGKSAARQVTGRAVKITKVRGQPYFDEAFQTIILPTLGPAHVARQPEHKELFAADMNTAASIIEAGYSLNYNKQIDTKYEWCFDLGPHIEEIQKRKFFAADCEWSTFGHGPGEWYNPKTKILTVQITYKAGHSLVIPIDYDHPDLKKPKPWKAYRRKLIWQLKKLLEDPAIKKTGHNFKGDWLMIKAKLGIVTKGYDDDTLLLVHAIDENMLNKSQDDCVRRWVPVMAGGNDELNRDAEHVGKTRMDLLSPAKLLQYGGFDSDANFRLYGELTRILRQDEKSYNCYRRVPMPANRAFCELEQEGFTVSIDALEALENHLQKKLYGDPDKIDPVTGQPDTGEYGRLIRIIPASIRREYENTGVGLKLTRAELLRAYLFEHPDGLKLEPVVFTKSTAKLRDKSKRIPSTSSKQHLPYFKTGDPTNFIDGLIDFLKDEHLLTSNVRGFYKYIFNRWTDPDGKRYGKIHPSYLLHGTVTGRTSSKNPNGQNFPKRGAGARKALVKLYRSIFLAPTGHVLIEADFSQIELRLVAIASHCKAMLKVYRDGGDIHCYTASVVMGITLKEFMKLKETDRSLFDYKRFQAKAVNFGFIYGMGWRKFITYARTEYDIVFTDEEAQLIRERFFDGFDGLSDWQEGARTFARTKGYVRAFDGRKRHLPSVDSDDDQISAGAERQGINSPIQGFGNDLGLMAIARITAQAARDLLRLCGFIHDALIAVAPKERAMEAARTIKRFMESNPLEEWFGFKPPIPFLADVSISATSLADMIECEDLIKDEKLVSWNDFKRAHDAREEAKKNPKPRTIKIRPRTFVAHPKPTRKAA